VIVDVPTSTVRALSGNTGDSSTPRQQDCSDLSGGCPVAPAHVRRRRQVATARLGPAAPTPPRDLPAASSRGTSGSLPAVSELFAAAVSIAPTKRRRFLWAAWWTAPPARDPFRKPDASEGGARTRDEALRHAERAAGRTLVQIEPLWARAWARVLMGLPPFTQAVVSPREPAANLRPPRSGSASDSPRTPRSRRSAPPFASAPSSRTPTAGATPRPFAPFVTPTTRPSPAAPAPASALVANRPRPASPCGSATSSAELLASGPSPSAMTIAA
jgi:hypothetical protein